MISLAAVIGIIAGWIFHVAYVSPTITRMRNRIVGLEKENKRVATEANEYWIRLQVVKAFSKGVNGLPYENR